MANFQISSNPIPKIIEFVSRNYINSLVYCLILCIEKAEIALYLLRGVNQSMACHQKLTKKDEAKIWLSFMKFKSDTCISNIQLLGLWIQYLDIFHRVITVTEIIVDFHEPTHHGGVGVGGWGLNLLLYAKFVI